jgi:hypothetical protein
MLDAQRCKQDRTKERQGEESEIGQAISLGSSQGEDVVVGQKQSLENKQGQSLGSGQGQALPLCVHAAALFYQWLAQPSLFATHDISAVMALPGKASEKMDSDELHEKQRKLESIGVQSTRSDGENDVTTGGNMEKEQTEGQVQGQTQGLPLQRYSIGPTPTGNLQTLLSQSSLSELRAIAREYNLLVSNVPRQQLAESIYAELKKPDSVRRIATTLEKSQRQLLAALILAGGAMSDDDLRGLFERFSLGQPSHLQHILLTLQSKALLFRTSLNASSLAQRSHHGLLNNALLDIGWYVPLEVRNALRVTVPITVFDVKHVDEQGVTPEVEIAEPSGPLPMLLVAARLLDGYLPGIAETWYEIGEARRSPDPLPSTRAPNSHSADGSVAIPSPEDLPPPSLLLKLQEHMQQKTAFLRFILRVLRVADLFDKRDAKPSALLLKPAIAERLLGPAWMKTLATLFELWLTQASYGDLYDLNDEHIRLRSRATSLNVPVLRSGELELENNLARQSIVALLAQAPLQQWMSFSSFARFVYRLNPLFLQQRQHAGQARILAAPQWWMELDEGRPLRPLQLSDWQRAELVYLMRMIAGPLHWWGICDIASSADGRLVAFRLTPTADWLLNGHPFDVQAERVDRLSYVDALKVTDDSAAQGQALPLLLIACSVHNWPVIQLLEMFTEAIGIQQGLLCYRLSPEAFSLALGRGLRPVRLVQLLHQVTEMKAISDPMQAQLFSQITRQLEQWSASYGRVRLYTGVTLLETADPAIMRELAATTSLEERVVQNIHPALCIIKPQMIAQIVDELKQRGQSPLLHDEDL